MDLIKKVQDADSAPTALVLSSGASSEGMNLDGDSKGWTAHGMRTTSRPLGCGPRGRALLFPLFAPPMQVLQQLLEQTGEAESPSQHSNRLQPDED